MALLRRPSRKETSSTGDSPQSPSQGRPSSTKTAKMPLALTNISLGIGGGASATSSGAPPPSSSWDNEYSVSFDGVDDYVSFTQFDFPTAKTVSYWIYFNSINSSGNTIFGQGSNYYSHLVANGQTMYIYTNYGSYLGTFSLGSTHAITTGSWIHIAIVGDGTTATLYKNGVSRATTTDVSPIGVERFGGHLSGRYLDGEMDEVAYWDSALTATNISDIYNSGTPVNLGVGGLNLSPVHWWRCGDNDGGTGTTITDQGKDSSGNPSGNDATLQSDASFVTDVP